LIGNKSTTNSYLERETLVINIRRATPADVKGIAAVVQEVWKQSIDYEVCHSQIKDDACAIWVAIEGNEVAGFVSAFLTVRQDEACRWEVDLLAVRPISQGHRLGQKLVEATWADAWKHRVKVARAAVRVDNIASQRTFARAGYTTDRQVYKLFLWSPEPADGQLVCPQSVTLLPINTITYRGLWIEGLTSDGVSEDEQRRAIMAARALIAREGRLNTGALIPVETENLLADDMRATATVPGEYHWWRKPLQVLKNES
jgi:N-acetylglutamate synthase-like GNAT family acetyltransferase